MIPAGVTDKGGTVKTTVSVNLAQILGSDARVLDCGMGGLWT